MEEIIDLEAPLQKTYPEKAIWVGTILGGPLVAGYMIAENFKALNEPYKARQTWIITIIASVVIFGGLLLLPENSSFPNGIIPLIYGLIAVQLFKGYQGKNIQVHINSGGKYFNWGRSICVALLGLPALYQ
jgi:hypothetical protein